MNFKKEKRGSSGGGGQTSESGSPNHRSGNPGLPSRGIRVAVLVIQLFAT